MGIMVLIAVYLAASCKTVKEYQKSRINDSEMTLSNRLLKKLN